MKNEEASLLIWGKGLEPIMYLFISPKSPEYFSAWGVFMHIYFHIELGKVIFYDIFVGRYF
jgi:hypothetical protein